MTDMTFREVDTGVVERFGPIQGTLLMQLPDVDGLPMIQIFSGSSRWHLQRRTRQGPLDYATVWIDVDVGRGPFEVVEDRPWPEIEADVRRFFGNDPRVDVVIQWLPRP